MALSYHIYTGDGVTTDFNFTKPYISKSHIHAYLDSSETSAFSWLTDTQIRFAVAPGAGVKIKLARVTPTTPLTDFSNGSTLVDEDLDRVSLQTLYVAEESSDTVANKMDRDNGGNWDALGKQIHNVLDGTAPTDAVNKEQLDAVQVANGNVPTPGAGNVGKYLQANGASTFVWQTIPTPASADESTQGLAEIATQAETDTGTDDARFVTPKKLKASKYNPIGKHTFPINAASLLPALTNGATFTQAETTTNKVNFTGLSFDPNTAQSAWIPLTLPKSWDGGSITFVPIWTAASGTGNVVWNVTAVAVKDAASLDVAVGADCTVTDTLNGNYFKQTGSESGAITIAGSAVAGDTVWFCVKRNAADAGDTLTTNAILLEIDLNFSTAKGTDV